MEYLENNPEIFFSIFLAITAYMFIVFYLGGRKAEVPFKGITDQRIIFRERGASGHSKKSILTKLGGASRALDVIVTSQELCIKGIWPMFTFIGSKYDLAHRVPLSNIERVESNGQKVEIQFRNSEGEETLVELSLKSPNDFINAIGT